jgi:hypothetical protein
MSLKPGTFIRIKKILDDCYPELVGGDIGYIVEELEENVPTTSYKYREDWFNFPWYKVIIFNKRNHDLQIAYELNRKEFSIIKNQEEALEEAMVNMI